MKEILTRKQLHLLTLLTKKISQLSKFMQSEGISQCDINTFFIECVFQAFTTVVSRKKKASQQFNSETQEQTNSETSDRVIENLEISLEKVIMSRLQSGQKMQKILLTYTQKCCIQEQKLKNYLLSQEQVQNRSRQFKKSSFDFQKIRERIQQKKYINKIDKKQSLIEKSLITYEEPSLTDICSIGDRYEAISPRRRIDETQKELDHMRSFERSLAESIRKTKLLRAMLEKQLSSEFSTLTFNRNQQRIREDEEIY